MRIVFCCADWLCKRGKLGRKGEWRCRMLAWSYWIWFWMRRKVCIVSSKICWKKSFILLLVWREFEEIMMQWWQYVQLFLEVPKIFNPFCLFQICCLLPYYHLHMIFKSPRVNSTFQHQQDIFRGQVVFSLISLARQRHT